MKRYLKKYGIRLGAGVLVLALLIALAASRREGRTGPMQNLFASLGEPVQQTVESAAGWLEGIYGYIYKYDRLQEENESLRIQLADAQAQLRDAAGLIEENERYRELLGYLEKHSDFDTEAARIISWETSNWTDAFTISKGEKHGVKIGDCVISSAGELVGQVTELGPDWAVVCTVIDVNMSVGVLVGEVSSAAILEGEFSLMQKGLARLSYLAEGAIVLTGDTVTTSGKGGLFPQGVVVGTVEELRSEAGGQTMFGLIKPACDFTKLSQVFVVKEFEVVE
ncbi:MAG: rod shape-determining protein MreC [Eubacteriales bacterium]|nr:rod shape-determining protein MreC [Eubacteriales bacterium]